MKHHHHDPAVGVLVLWVGCVPTGGDDKATATDPLATTTTLTSTDGETGATTTTGGDPDTTRGGGHTTTSTTTTSVGSSTTTGTTTGTTTSTTAVDPPDSICGNGIVEGDEECDDGGANADDQACTSSCVAAECGDGLVWSGHEECDLGVENDNEGACTKACLKAWCGDGLIQEGVEECDKGADNNATEYGGCIPGTCKLGPHCGDGEAQLDHEECDDADPEGNESLALCKGCTWDSKIVFVTSVVYNGKLGGLQGADDLCRGLAKAAGLDNDPAFKAWLSDGTKSASERMTKSMSAYALIQGKTIAKSWGDLVDGQLASPINVNESGVTIDPNDANVWTSTTAAGALSAVGTHCSGWSSGSWSSTARVGDAMKTDKGWTDDGTKECDQLARLYCVEQ
ncbi:MAG: hypothetical protein R3B09_01160 [Nannocystaceae bacterium]